MQHSLNMRTYISLSALLFVLGIFFYGIYNEIIIFRLPFQKIGVPALSAQRSLKKFYYWKGSSFATEEKRNFGFSEHCANNA